MWRVGVLLIGFLALITAPFGYCAASWAYVQTQREAAGIQSLEWDTALADSAQTRAEEIARLEALDHSGAAATSAVFYGDRPYVCEILGTQPTTTQDYAIGYGWVTSPAHRDCALGANYRRAAMGVTMGKDGWVYEAMWLTE